MKRVVLLILDGVGAGELPDAKFYGDEGTNTLANTAAAVGGLDLPNLGSLGLGNIISIAGVPPAPSPRASFGRMAELSAGKDTTTGHWELAGLILEKPFPVYPDGFPPELIAALEKRTGRKVIGNVAASGTEIIEKLGEEHMRTGCPIVYTSADSVFQIAAHEEVIPVEELYEICRAARELLQGEHGVGRVIARPFEGKPGSFKRTARRHDFSLKPVGRTVLDLLVENGHQVTAVGKVADIFAGVGITKAVAAAGNEECFNKTLELLSEGTKGLIFTNLVDFDTLYGHRNDVVGMAKALVDLDRRLPQLLDMIGEEEVLIITADHGCDPTTPGTDHTREYVPLLILGGRVKGGVDLGVRRTFADVAATIAEIFGYQFGPGTSFWREVKMF